MMARLQGKPDPFARKAKRKADEIDSTTTAEDKEHKTQRTSENNSTSTDESAATSKNAEKEPATKGDSSDETVSEPTTTIDEPVTRLPGESLKDYRQRLKREANRIIKVRSHTKILSLLSAAA